MRLNKNQTITEVLRRVGQVQSRAHGAIRAGATARPSTVLLVFASRSVSKVACRSQLQGMPIFCSGTQHAVSYVLVTPIFLGIKMDTNQPASGAFDWLFST